VGRTPQAASAAGLGLPVELVTSLDDAFASEVAVRLPRLLGAALRLRAGAPEAASEILSDTHALASSAAVVGEDVAAYAARECEQLLTAYVHATGPVDAVVRIAGAVDALGLALARWIDTSRGSPLVPHQVAGRG
jgi:hypothetical protein